MRRATWFACEGSAANGIECEPTHLELDRVDDFFEMFGQDVALDGERTHAFVLVCKIGVDAAEG